MKKIIQGDKYGFIVPIFLIIFSLWLYNNSNCLISKYLIGMIGGMALVLLIESVVHEIKLRQKKK
jgi:uncharacterized YccA/Bax inhibitor family protein